MKTFSFVAALVASLLYLAADSTTARAQSEPVKLGNLVISETWARPTPPTAKTGAAFFMITNSGTEDEVLTGAAAGISDKTEIHQTKIDGGVMTMRHVGRIEIPAGGMAVLKPGSFHIMFMGLHAPIKPGDHFPLTLTFEKSGSVEVRVTASSSPKAGAMDKMQHDMKAGH